MDFIYKRHYLYRVYCHCLGVRVSEGISQIPGFSSLMGASILMTDNILYQNMYDFQEFHIVSGTLIHLHRH